MPDKAKGTEAEEQANAERIKWEETSQQVPRGNVHSEPDDKPVEQELPPPQPG